MRAKVIERQAQRTWALGFATGDDAGPPQVHAHVVVGKRYGSAHRGHLLDARVPPTLGVMLTESPSHLQRALDRETGLAPIDITPPAGG